MNIIKELKVGNLEIFKEMFVPEICETFSLVAKSPFKNKILRTILPKFYDDAYKYDISKEVFDLIYLDKRYKEYTFYLLHKGYVIPESIRCEQIERILNETKWGFDFIYDNIEELLEGIYGLKNIDVILNYCVDKPEKYEKIYEKVIKSENNEVIENFIIKSINKDIINDEQIIMSLYKYADDFRYEQLSLFEEEKEYNSSRVPGFLLMSRRISEKLSKYKDVLINSSKDKKMGLIKYFIEKEKCQKYIEKYSEVLRLYKAYEVSFNDRIISLLISYHKLDYLTELLKDKKIKLLSIGSTATPFRIGDEVVKFSYKKHDQKHLPELFLFAPTTTTELVNETGETELIIERQPFLDKEYNGSEMTRDDITNWLNELYKLRYETTDPHNLDKTFENYGFLRDYHEANLGSYKSHEDLPEWFKKRPVVLFDIDLIYEQEDRNKRYFRTF